MSQAVLVLALLAPPSGPERAALSAYEHTRQVSLRPVVGSPRREPYPPYDQKLVAELEAELEAARTAAASLDEPRAVELIERFDDKLLAHPELPQSAWLLAEREQVGAAGAPTAGEGHLRQARAIEGQRAPEYGKGPVAPGAPLVESQVRIEGLDARDQLELDGKVLEGRVTSITPGRHHVRVVRAGRLVLARWLRVGEGATALVLELAPIAPCSAEDVAGYRIDGDRVLPAAGTRCERWVLADRAPHGLRFADCFADRCGPFVTLTGEALALAMQTPQPERERPSRVLFNVALAGAALVAGGGILLWQSGALDEQDPPRQRWVYGGLTPAD